MCLSIVADCILEFTQYSIEKSFSIRDIWDSPYTNENVKMIFSKPDLNSDFSMHEYDKFFSQPIKLLAYSGILFETKTGNRNVYTIQNIELLEYLMQRETNALKFLILYIQKVLMDSGIDPIFDNFLQTQDAESFKQLKDGFTHFTINNTAIKNTTECFRIFTKIINPLAFYYGKKGTRKGFLSNTIITKDELNYNRINWRDIGKDKNITRQEYDLINSKRIANSNYLISKAKKVVKQYNDKFNHSLSEVKGEKGYFLEEIKERLNALGYQLSYQILNAKDYGVPQNRERAFIVGASRFSFDFNLLEPSQSVSVQDVISDLAYLCSNEGSFESDYLNPIQSSYQALMRKDSPKLYNHQATNHSQAALEKLKLINKEQGKECLPKNLHGKQQFKSTWGCLNWNKISPTIDTRFDTPSNGTNSHPELHRSITPREATRIQSFSDNYIFYGNKTSVCKQIGNAVPSLLALALCKAILKSARNDTNLSR